MNRSIFLILILVSLTAGLFVSCSKRDITPASPVLPGTWTWDKWGLDGNKDGVFSPGEIQNLDGQNIRFVFNTDGSGLYTGGVINDVAFNWALVGNNVMTMNFAQSIPGFNVTSYHLDSLTTHSFRISDTNSSGYPEYRTFSR